MTAVLVFHTILVVAFTARILLRDDLSPPARLAWFVVLNLLPYFGIAVYFLFGEIDIGRRLKRRHQEVFAEIRTGASAFMGDADDIARLIAPAYRPAFRYAGSINGFHPVDGNAAGWWRTSTRRPIRCTCCITSGWTTTPAPPSPRR